MMQALIDEYTWIISDTDAELEISWLANPDISSVPSYAEKDSELKRSFWKN